MKQNRNRTGASQSDTSGDFRGLTKQEKEAKNMYIQFKKIRRFIEVVDTQKYIRLLFFMFVYFIFIIGCNGGKSDMGEIKIVELFEEDYYLFCNEDEYIKIKITNKNAMDKLFKIAEPIIIIHINKVIKTAKGMSVIDSEIPLPCNYTFEIELNKRTAVFDNADLLVLTPIEKYCLSECYELQIKAAQD